MPALPATQQSDWNNNVYVLWTTRGLAMVGVFGLAYMVKRSYIRMPSIRGTGVGSLVAASVGAAPLAAVVADATELGDMTSDTLATTPGAVGADPDLEASLTAEVHRQQPVCDPHIHTGRSRHHDRAQERDTGTPGALTGAHSGPEQDFDIRSDQGHIAEGLDVAINPTS